VPFRPRRAPRWTTISAREGGKGSVEDALTETSSLLSGLTAGAGLVLAAKSDTRLKHIEFIRLEPTKGLVVLVGEDGNIENRLIDLPDGLPASALTEAANFLNAHLRGKTLGEAQRALAERERAVAAELDKLTRQVVDAGIASWAGAEEGKPRQLIIRGRANLLEDISAVEDLERIRLLFEDLDSKKELPASCRPPKPPTASASSSARKTSSFPCPVHR
jgi:heat-inducible transcriptional repressor